MGGQSKPPHIQALVGISKIRILISKGHGTWRSPEVIKQTYEQDEGPKMELLSALLQNESLKKYIFIYAFITSQKQEEKLFR